MATKVAQAKGGGGGGQIAWGAGQIAPVAPPPSSRRPCFTVINVDKLNLFVYKLFLKKIYRQVYKLMLVTFILDLF